MTMTSTYDHRVIQGAESGRFLKVVEEYLQGEHGFYDELFSQLGSRPGPLPAPPAPAAAAAAARDAATPQTSPAETDVELLRAVQAAVSLLKAHRTHGHLAARLDPLGREPEGDPALEPEPLGLTKDLMARIPAQILRIAVPGATLADALPHMRETYCGTIAYEIEHIASHRQRTWLRAMIESGEFRTPLRPDEQRALLKRLIEVDALERFMHKAYLGQKQFSIEGLDMTVPMLDEMIQLCAAHGGREVVLGMAHRGRLNVLAHNLGRPYDTIFAEFEGASTLEAVTTIPQGGTGDVKYHHGAQGSYQLPDGSSILVNLESNPSHLEYVGAGRDRRDARRADDAPRPARAPGRRDRRADRAARRRCPARPGGRSGDAEPAGARRLLGRRHAAPRAEQPGRLHDRSRRCALDALGVGCREGLRRADHPRQRRRRRGLHRRRPARVRVPPGVRPRRHDRPHRLPPLRPQRGRRARLHPARAGRPDPQPPARRGHLGRPARRPAGRDDARTSSSRRTRCGTSSRACTRSSRRRSGTPTRSATSISRRASTRSTARRRRRSRPRSAPSAC